MIWVIDSDPIALKVTTLTLARSYSHSEIMPFQSPGKAIEILKGVENNQDAIPKHIISDVHFPLIDADTFVNQILDITFKHKIECIFCTVLPIQHYLSYIPKQSTHLKLFLKPFSIEYLLENIPF